MLPWYNVLWEHRNRPRLSFVKQPPPGRSPCLPPFTWKLKFSWPRYQSQSPYDIAHVGLLLSVHVGPPLNFGVAHAAAREPCRRAPAPLSAAPPWARLRRRPQLDPFCYKHETASHHCAYHRHPRGRRARDVVFSFVQDHGVRWRASDYSVATSEQKGHMSLTHHPCHAAALKTTVCLDISTEPEL